MPAANQRKPWPLKWVMLPTLLFIVLYTVLTLVYRRPEPAYRPYEEAKNRASTGRLLEAGFQRVALSPSRPAVLPRNVAPPSVATTTEPGGVPASLKSVLIDQPTLVAVIDRVSAPASIAPGDRYPIEVAGLNPDNQHEIIGGTLYHRGSELIVVPAIAKVADGLKSRSREQVIVLEVPGGTLKPGSYTVSVLGAQASRGWTLQVR